LGIYPIHERNILKITFLDRLLLLATGLLAAWQIAVGIDRLSTLPIIAYTMGFGVLLVAGLLLIILGFDVLDSPIVVILSTIIPISLSLGLVWEKIPTIRSYYLIFSLVGFAAIVITRTFTNSNILRVVVLAVVHGVAGVIIFLLPCWLAISGRSAPGFALVGLGGALIGIGGLLLSFLRGGKPLLSRQTVFRILPGLFLLMTVSFVAGFHFG
jgi:hypothetical protein